MGVESHAPAVASLEGRDTVISMTGFIFTASDDLRWLRHAACADLEIKDFFVEAGHVIDEEVLNTCRSCPVRQDCIRHAYKADVTGGYFGGLSPGQRRDLDLDEALEFARTDTVERRESISTGPSQPKQTDQDEILYT